MAAPAWSCRPRDGDEERHGRHERDHREEEQDRGPRARRGLGRGGRRNRRQRRRSRRVRLRPRNQRGAVERERPAELGHARRRHPCARLRRRTGRDQSWIDRDRALSHRAIRIRGEGQRPSGPTVRSDSRRRRRRRQQRWNGHLLGRAIRRIGAGRVAHVERGVALAGRGDGGDGCRGELRAHEHGARGPSLRSREHRGVDDPGRGVALAPAHDRERRRRRGPRGRRLYRQGHRRRGWSGRERGGAPARLRVVDRGESAAWTERAEEPDQLGRARYPPVEVALQATGDHVADAGAHVGRHGLDAGHRLRQDLPEHGHRLRPGERPPSRQHLEEDHAERPDVGAAVDPAAAELLGARCTRASPPCPRSRCRPRPRR